MTNSFIVFCTARTEIVSRAVRAILKEPTDQTVVYTGPSDSPFAIAADRFISWGSGPFNIWKAVRLRSSWGYLRPQTVILPLNRDDGKGYFMLRLFALWISRGKTLEVTPEETIRSVNIRRFSDTYHIEEIFHRFLITIFNYFKPIFKNWLRPQKIVTELGRKATKLSHTFLRDFELNKTPEVSIIIRTFNEERFLAETLAKVYQQEGCSLEVILIDSESTDTTVQIAQSFHVRLVKIKKESFSYGAALNLGAQLARGRYLVNLSAHAIPANKNWLRELIGPLNDPHVAGVHGSEQPIEGHCGLLERKILIDSFPNAPLDQTKDFFFSNANAALRKQLVLENPFDETVAWAEDRLWAKHMQELGFKIIYHPKAAVYHSHNLSARQNFERSYKFFAIQFGKLYANQAREIRNGFHHSLPGRVLAFRRFLSDQNRMTPFQSFIYAPFCEYVNYLGCEYAWEQWNLNHVTQSAMESTPVMQSHNQAMS